MKGMCDTKGKRGTIARFASSESFCVPLYAEANVYR